MITHFYSKYGLAILLNDLESVIELKDKASIKKLLSGALEKFRVRPKEPLWANTGSVDFIFDNILKGDTKNGVYLSPHIISPDKSAQALHGKIKEIIDSLDSVNLDDMTEIQQLYAPTAGEYNNGSKSRQKASVTFLEALCCMLTTITDLKPAYSHIVVKGDQPTYHNTTIIPDLDIADLQAFINLFRNMYSHADKSAMMKGNIKDGKPLRPYISNGNFPYASRNSGLSPVYLLVAISECIREASYYRREEVESVLDSLKEAPIYIVSHNSLDIVTYSHFTIELAKDRLLFDIVKSISKIVLYRWAKDTSLKDRERDINDHIIPAFKRFLYFFDSKSFRELLSIRGEYPTPFFNLFKVYFMEIRKIDIETVLSAKALGSWLNYVAYLVATKESSDRLRVLDYKAKVLVELESTIFSAKTGSALISQVITRAGRLSQRDAPGDAALFIERVLSGEIELLDAQQILMSFLRLKSKLDSANEVGVTSSETLDDSENQFFND